MGLLVQCPLGHIFSQLRSQNRNLSAILSDFRCVLGRVLHRFERSSTYSHGMSVDVLDREMFTEAEAARLLRVHRPDAPRVRGSVSASRPATVCERQGTKASESVLEHLGGPPDFQAVHRIYQ